MVQDVDMGKVSRRGTRFGTISSPCPERLKLPNRYLLPKSYILDMTVDRKYLFPDLEKCQHNCMDPDFNGIYRGPQSSGPSFPESSHTIGVSSGKGEWE